MFRQAVKFLCSVCVCVCECPWRTRISHN